MKGKVVFIDVNLPMYAAGTAHANKAPSARFLDRVAKGEVDAVTDAEVFQEILHRYRAIGELETGLTIYDEFRRIVPVVLSISVQIVDAARRLLEDAPIISSRDALHVAVMQHAEVQRIASFDPGFDQVRGIKRIQPR